MLTTCFAVMAKEKYGLWKQNLLQRLFTGDHGLLEMLEAGVTTFADMYFLWIKLLKQSRKAS